MLNIPQETWEVRQIAIKKCKRGRRGGRRQTEIFYDTMSALKCSCRSCGQEYTVRDSNYLNTKKHARSASMGLEGPDSSFSLNEDFFMDEKSYDDHDGRSHDSHEDGTMETLNHSSDTYDFNVLR